MQGSSGELQSQVKNLRGLRGTVGMESVQHLKHPPKLEGLFRWAEGLCSPMPRVPGGAVAAKGHVSFYD